MSVSDNPRQCDARRPACADHAVRTWDQARARPNAGACYAGRHRRRRWPRWSGLTLQAEGHPLSEALQLSRARSAPGRSPCLTARGQARISDSFTEPGPVSGSTHSAGVSQPYGDVARAGGTAPAPPAPSATSCGRAVVLMCRVNRVVAAGGRLGGYGGRESLKRALLAAEGVSLRGSRVVLGQSQWKPRSRHRAC